MVLEDSEFMRRFLSKFLSKKMELTLVSDGLEALKRLHEGMVPDLIIADINMPNIDGFEFLEHMQESPLFRHIPVIILSGNDDSKDRIRCLQLGAVDYIVKPFNPVELELRVSGHLSRSPMRKQL